MIAVRILVVIIFFILTGCKGKNNSPEISQQQKQLDITGINLTDLTGQPVEMSSFKGKTVFLNFWATWCIPCREEMPSIQNAMEKLKEKNIEFLFASDEDREEINKFKAANDFTFNYVRTENMDVLNVMVLPTTFIFNPDGKLVFSERGYRKWDDKKSIDLILNSGK